MSTDTALFSPVPLAYAQSYTELESARMLFEDERRRLLENLRAQLRNLVAKNSLRINKEKFTEGAIDLYLDGEYTATRAKLKTPKLAGISIVMRPYGEFMGFQTAVWFACSARTFKKLRETPLPSAVELAQGVDGRFHTESSGNFRLAAIPFQSPQFTRTCLALELERLVEVWPLIDHAMAAAYAQLKGSSAD